MRKEIEHALSLKIETDEKSSSGRCLFFPENMLSGKYRKLFGIEDVEFDEAFRVVTGGMGNELAKINSLTSSSLLSLLVFYPLFNKNTKDSLTLSVNGNLISFTNCFFEIRNKVIRLPSCVDVVLQSEDKKTLLFLESKFLEYEDTTTEATYGKGYYSLYSEYLRDYLTDITVASDNKGRTKLTSKTRIYIEGLKQSISHLIGLVRGPKDETAEYYTKEYLKAYSKAYKGAKTLMYGTILFNPDKFDGDASPYINYADLYTRIIGKQGGEIVEGIRKWCHANHKNDEGKEISILEHPLTYQNDIPPTYKERLPRKIRDFYLL